MPKRAYATPGLLQQKYLPICGYTYRILLDRTGPYEPIVLAQYHATVRYPVSGGTTMACMQKRLGPRYRMQMHLKSVQRSVPFPTLAHTWCWIIQTEHAVYAQHHAYRLNSLRYSLRALHA